MNKLYNLFFSHDFLILDIQQKRFRTFYGIAILFFVCFTIFTFQPIGEVDVLDSSSPLYMTILDTLLVVTLIYSFFVFKKSGWFIFVGSLISISISTIRFFSVMLLIHLIEFIFHVLLIKIGFLSSKTLNSALDHIEFISFVYYYFILLSFLYFHYKSEVRKVDYITKLN